MKIQTSVSVPLRGYFFEMGKMDYITEILHGVSVPLRGYFFEILGV